MSKQIKSFPVGSKVRFTGKFLRSTGQYTGSEGKARFIVQECDCGLCKLGNHVRTDQPGMVDYYTADEIKVNPSLAFRHVAIANVEIVR